MHAQRGTSRPISSRGTPAPRRAGFPAHRPRAFTLLELILVILLIALFASVTAPRFTGNQSRRADQEAELLRSLLTTVAHRAATTTEPLALIYDAQTSTFAVEVRRFLQPPRGGVPELAWRRDALIAPVTLSLTQLRDASADLHTLGARSWRLDLPPTEPRPAIRLTLAGRAQADAARTWTIDLAPGAPAATLTLPGATPAPASSLPQAIDLDAAGRGQQPW